MNCIRMSLSRLDQKRIDCYHKKRSYTCIRCEGHDHHIPRLRRLWGQAQQALSALKPCFLSGVQRNAALLLKDIYPKYYFRFG
jgi:hypothetical protein